MVHSNNIDLKKDLYNTYSLFSNNKFDELIQFITSHIYVLNEIINDNRKLVQYAVQINNKHLFDSIINIDKSQLLCQSPNYTLPHIALVSGHFDLMFYIIDLIIKNKLYSNDQTNNSKLHIFTSNNSILHAIIKKKNFELFIKFFDKYKKYIDWINNINTQHYQYIYDITTTFYEDFDKLFDVYYDIIKLNNKHINDLFIYPENNNSMFFLIYTKYVQTKDKISLISNELLKKFILLCPKQLSYTNESHITPIYYFVMYNDIDMLRFSIKLGADINYVPKHGRNIFCNFIMETANCDIIEYILTLDINCNSIDINNETPVFSLYRRYNSIEDHNRFDKLVQKLLLKTDNWDQQNIYGQSIIHLLCTNPNIKKYYPTLRTKYFNINIQNRYGDSSINILEKTLKDNKLNEKNIQKEINKFKSLVVNNYINIIKNIESNKVDDVKKICKTKNNNCKKQIIKKLTKSEFSDIDNMDNNYVNLQINNYQFSYYNLYNARDIELFYYYYFISRRNKNIGFPINTDVNNILFKKNIIDDNDKNNVESIQSLINNIQKYKYINEMNIYWCSNNIFAYSKSITNSIKTCIDNGKEIIIVRLNIIKSIYHANILLIDTLNKRIIRFEPLGNTKIHDVNDLALNELIKTIFRENTYFDNYTFFMPNDYEPINGLQNISQETNYINMRVGDIGGFCAAWCLWFIELYVQNLHNGLLKNNNLKLLLPKTIKKIINSGHLISEHIRNYANNLHYTHIDFLTQHSFKLYNLYFNEYTRQELDDLYQYIDLLYSKI